MWSHVVNNNNLVVRDVSVKKNQYLSYVIYFLKCQLYLKQIVK